MDYLDGLNPQQREAVCHREGPLLILAGAGSGKTRVITHRAARLIGVERVSPDAVLAVTFTNKAADEMRGRVESLLATGGLACRPWVSTFHSFALRVLRRDGASLAAMRPGFTQDFSVYDEDEQLAVVKLVFRRLGLNEEFMQYKAAQSRISNAKNRGETPQTLYRVSTDARDERMAVVYDEYEKALLLANALDFDDLLLECVRLLRHDETVRAAYNSRFEYLMIDEYQDTNRSQYELMRLLTVARQNVCAVGDEDQSIYGWRGADIRNILDFERDYPKARVIRLEQNYRSTKPILEAASALVSRNSQRMGKWLWTEHKGGHPVFLAELEDGEQEALFIAEMVLQSRRRDEATRIAVLYRTNAQSRQLEEAFRRYSVAYHVVGGFSFYQRAEIRDALAYLKLVDSPSDSVSLYRIINTPARGIGRTTVEAIERYAAERGIRAWEAIGERLKDGRLPSRAAAALDAFRKLIEELRETASQQALPTVLRQIIERTGYRRMLESDTSPAAESRLENLSELLNATEEAAERGESVGDFLDHAALVSDSDQLDESAAVSLLTLHNAKGLEFPEVFIAGLEEGLCPHNRSFGLEPMIEEERRLLYVGMTRARSRLTLCWTRARRRFGAASMQQSKPSRFLAEIPRALTVNLHAGAPAEVDLGAERQLVRESVERTTYTGKTYNSLDHIRQFFADRGLPQPMEVPSPPPRVKPPASRPERKKGGIVGSTIEHPRFGKGMVVRCEGEGDEAKLTVSFPGHGLKKLVRKYAGLKIQE